MTPGTRPTPLPEQFIISGERRSTSDLPHPDQGWILHQTNQIPPLLVVEPYPQRPEANFQVSCQLKEHTGKGTISYNPIPSLEGFSWDWIELVYPPLKELQVKSHYWAPETRLVGSEIQVINLSESARRFELDLICLPQPRGRRNQIILEEYKGRPVLTGTLDQQTLALFLLPNPSPKYEPFPYLQSVISLGPGEGRMTRWICAISATKTEALELIEYCIQLDWPGEIAHRKVRQQSQLDIKTGDPDRDIALALSRKQGQLLSKRLFSRGDQHPSPFAGISPFQALFFIQSLQPLTAESARNILDGVFYQFLPGDDQEGKSDQDQNPPLFSTELLWQVHQSGFDLPIWSDYLLTAASWIESWFTSDHDRDQDGIPESVRSLSLDLTGADVDSLPEDGKLTLYPYLESPGLGAVLYNELCKLGELAQISGITLDTEVQKKKDALFKFLQESWSAEKYTFQARDSASHAVIEGFKIMDGIQPGLNILKAAFQQPTRIGVLVRHLRSQAGSGKYSIIFQGQDPRGNSRVEEIQSTDLTWSEGQSWAITESVFSELDTCSLTGFPFDNQISLIAPSTAESEITQTLPLWAGIAAADQAATLIKDNLLDPNRYWTPYGFCSRPGTENPIIHNSWNLLLGQALAQVERPELAVELIHRWLAALIPSITRSGASFAAYQGKTGNGIGAQDLPESLFPLKFFLQLLGFHFIRDKYLVIEGHNPFPWPVTLRYRGLVIERGKEETTIKKPGGETFTLPGPERYHLELR